MLEMAESRLTGLNIDSGKKYIRTEMDVNKRNDLRWVSMIAQLYQQFLDA
jgi:hypothetical protein